MSTMTTRDEIIATARAFDAAGLAMRADAPRLVAVQDREVAAAIEVLVMHDKVARSQLGGYCVGCYTYYRDVSGLVQLIKHADIDTAQARPARLLEAQHHAFELLLALVDAGEPLNCVGETVKRLAREWGAREGERHAAQWKRVHDAL